jgi:signal transduction histidine kinase
MKVGRGLQAKMTASYVAVTAVAVLAVEAVVIGLVAPRALSQQDLLLRVRATANALAGKLSTEAAQVGRLPVTRLGEPGLGFTPGQAQPDPNGSVVVPEISTRRCDPGPASFAIVVSKARTILASSYPACFRPGAALGSLPAAANWSIRPPGNGAGTAATPAGQVMWAAYPVISGGKPGAGKVPSVPGKQASAVAGQSPGAGGKAGQYFGTVYLEVPAKAPAPAGLNPDLVRAGLLLLGLTIPVGIGFGLLSTRRLTRRLGRLAASTLDVADGSFDRRVPVSGRDEVSQLEQNFNRMAERLETALDAERELAGANARHDERSRIARELHDSISQDLFSLSMLAGGLRKALPAGSDVLPEVHTMERTASAAMREMQALLLEIRPVALNEIGLTAALRELCAAYRERLGVAVSADTEPLLLPTALEHALLRVAQEALANAVKHAGAATIGLRLQASDGTVVLEVTDDGSGIDPDTDGRTAGLGLRAMRERMREQGGTLQVRPGQHRGTTVLAMIPWQQQ